MGVDLPHLFGVLKDETRARVLEQLQQSESLSYGELQSLLKISHTGKLNYHLKVLGDLIVKDEESGRYSLTEKGKIAAALLDKYESAREPSIKVKSLALGAMAIGIVFASLSYIRGLISYETLGWSLLWTVALALALYFAPKVWETGNLRFRRFFYPLVYGLFFGFLLYGLVNLLLYNVLALPFWVDMDAGLRLLLTMPAAYAVAGYFGYRTGKKRGFAPPNWS